jgi:recombination protein RecA
MGFGYCRTITHLIPWRYDLSDEITDLNKKYSGFIKLPGEDYSYVYDYISTGSIAVDLALGRRGKVDGIPRGVITTIWGREGGGKSTLVANCMAEAQKVGRVAFANTELKFDPAYFSRVGVDLSELTVIDLAYHSGVYGEQIAQALVSLAKTGQYSMIVCDSIAALIPKRVADSDVGESNPGLRARLLKDMIERIISPIKHNNVALILTTQRSNNFDAKGFGAQKYNMVGGNNVQFYSAVVGRIDFIEQVRNTAKQSIGIRSRITLQKNVGITFGWADFSITDGLGIDKVRELFGFGDVAYNKGAWYYYVDPTTGEEVRIGQGAENAVAALRSDKALLDALIVKQKAIIEASSDAYIKSSKEAAEDGD